jgi:hypothetical protein
MLQPTVSRPSPGVKHPFDPYDQIFIIVRQLRVCWCGALSLTRERVCHLQLLLVFASAVILGSESRGTRDHILLYQIRDYPNLEGQDPVFISSRNRVAQLYPHPVPGMWECVLNSPGSEKGSVVNYFKRNNEHSFPQKLVTFSVFRATVSFSVWMFLCVYLKSFI